MSSIAETIDGLIMPTRNAFGKIFGNGDGKAERYEWARQAAAMRRQMEDMRQAAQERELRLREMADELAACAGANVARAREIVELNTGNEILRKAVDYRGAELEKAQAETKRLIGELDETREARNGYAFAMEEAMDETEDLKKANAECRAECEHLYSQNRLLSKTLREFDNNAKAACRRADELETRQEELLKEIAALREQANKASAAPDFISRGRKYEAAISRLVGKLTSERYYQRIASDNNAVFLKRAISAERKRDELDIDYEYLQQRYERACKKLSDYEEKFIASETGELARALGEMEDRAARAESLADSNGIMLQEREMASRATIKRLVNDNINLRAEHAACRDALARTRQDAALARDKAARAEQANESLRREVTELRGQIVSLNEIVA